MRGVLRLGRRGRARAMETVFRLAAVLAAVIVLTVLLTAGWSWANTRRKPFRTSEQSGTISPGKISAALVTATGLGVAAVGVTQLAESDYVIGGIYLLAGAALAIFMGSSLTHLHDVSWGPEGVTGPSKLFGLSLGLQRTKIAWSDVRRSGTTATSYWYIEATDHRRIYWSYLYPGYGQFVDRLASECPTIDRPWTI